MDGAVTGAERWKGESVGSEMENGENAAQERQAIPESDGKQGDHRSTGSYHEAVDFVLNAGDVPDDEFRRLAVIHSPVLLEILAGSPDLMSHFSGKNLDYGAVAVKTRDILHSLHFNRENDHYLSLLLPSDADESLIKRRWKDLMRIYHPDRNPGGIVMPADYAADSAKRLNEAYNVLKDHRAKFKYDRRSGHHGMQEMERPSFFTKPPGNSEIFCGLRKDHLKIALIIMALAVVAAGVIYWEMPAKHQATTSEISVPEGQRVVAGPARQEGAEGHSNSSLRPEGGAGKVSRAAAYHGGSGQNVRLAEDVYDFISRLETAFEKGDLEGYLSFYAKSATENGRGYDGIRDYYRDLFQKGRYRLSLGNVIISRERDGVKVRGLYSLAAPSGGRGTYEMRLKKVDGRFRIMDFRRVPEKPAGY